MAKRKTNPIDDGADWDLNDTGEVSVSELISAAKREGVFSYDLETSGLNPRRDRIEGVAFYVPNKSEPDQKPIRAWFPFVDGTMNHSVGGQIISLRKVLPQRETMEALRELWLMEDIIAVAHNGAFDMSFLMIASGCETPIIVKNKIADSMLADYVADERRKRYGLKIRVEQVFGHRMTTYTEASGKQGVFGFARRKPLGVYACDDTYWCYSLWCWAMDSIRRQDPDGHLEKIYWKIEMGIQRVILEMETTGCLIDWEWLVEVQERLENTKREILGRIKKHAGWAPNLRSPKQVSDFLYGKKEDGGLELPTDGLDYNAELDQYTTADKVISHFGKKIPVVKDLLEYRSCEVIDRSFCQKLISIAQSEERVRSHFRQTGTVIGRLSCVSGSTILETSVGSVAISDLDMSGKRNYTIETHQGRRQKILKKIYKGLDAMYEVRLDGGQSIKCTKDHRFLTPEGWRRLGDLAIGSELVVPTDIHQARQADEGRSQNSTRRCLVCRDLCQSAGYSGRTDGEIRDLLSDVNRLQAGLRSKVCGGPEKEASREPRESRHGGKAKSGRNQNGLQAQDQGCNSQGETGRVSSPWTQGCTNCTDPRHYRTPCSEEHQVSRHQAFTRAADVPFQARTRRIGSVRIDGSRLHRSGYRFLRQSAGVLPQAVSSVRTGSLPFRGSEIVCEESRLLQIDRSGGERSCNFLYESGRAPTINGTSRCRHSTPETAVCVQELGRGFYIPDRDVDGRGGWSISQNLREDTGSRRAEASKVRIDGISNPAVYDRGSSERVWPCRIGNRVFDTAKIESIVPIGVQGVWDITVEADHSYLAQGFINHNSAEPINLQNQPRDKNLIRKAFCARLPNEYDPERADLALYCADYGQMELRMAAHLAVEKNMIEVFTNTSGCQNGPDGGPCDRYTWYECLAEGCGKKAPPKENPDGSKVCSSCGSSKVEHQARCRHVDLHQRTSEDVGVPRNPLAKNCVTADAMLLTEHGLLEMGEVVTEPDRFKKKIGIMSDDGKVRQTDSTWSPGVKPVMDVELEYGIKVTATPDHEFYVMREGRVAKVMAADLQLGDPCLIMTGRNVHGSTIELPGIEVEGRASFKDIDLPTELTSEVARFFGYFVAEGRSETHPDRGYYQLQFGFSPSSTDMIADLDRCMSSAFPDTHISTSSTTEVIRRTVASKKLNFWMNHLGFKSGSGEKDIPKCVRTAPWALKREFFRALFEGDGTVKAVGKARDSFALVYTSKSERLIRQLHAEMMNIDILGFIHCEMRDTQKGEQPYWCWTIRRQRDIERFAERVGFVSTEKSDRLLESMSPDSADYANRFLDGVEILLETIYDKTRRKQKDKLREVIRRKTNPVRFGDTRLELLEDVLPDEIKSYRDAGIWTAKVRSVVDAGEAPVFDVYEPERTAMVVNSCVVADSNFGLLYRMGAPKFATYADLYDDKGQPMIEYASELIKQWHRAYPGIARWHDRTIEQLEEDNYIAYTLTRRRRRLDQDWRQSEYKAGTRAIQFAVSGSCQDIIKIAMTRIYDERNAKAEDRNKPAEAKLWQKFKFLIQVHDEILCEGPSQLREECLDMIKRNMEGVATNLRVPFPADARSGRTWCETH